MLLATLLLLNAMKRSQSKVSLLLLVVVVGGGRWSPSLSSSVGGGRRRRVGCCIRQRSGRFRTTLRSLLQLQHDAMNATIQHVLWLKSVVCFIFPLVGCCFEKGWREGPLA